MHELPTALKIYCGVLAAVLGACMGSFLNCYAWRIVHGESVWKGRSHCDACGHVLRPADLLPVVSYLVSGGRCRYCGKKLSARYLWSEIISALVFVSVLLRFGLSWETLEYLLLACALLACAFADLEDYLIPDRFILFAVAVRLAAVFLSGNILHDLGAALLGGVTISGALLLVSVVMTKILKRDAMGGGDVKLLFVTGLYLGWMRNFLCLMISCVLGMVMGLLYRNRKLTGEGGAFPWGPSIAAGAWLSLLFGQELLEWYQGLFS